MAKTQSSGGMGKRHIARAHKESEQQRKVLLVLGGVGLLVALVLIMGLLRIYVLIPRQPVAIVEGNEVSTADYRKRLLYQQFLIDEQILALRGQFEQIGQAFADNPELQNSLRNQTLQQVQQLLFLREELERTVLETMIEEELIKQEAARREISISEAEVSEAYETRAASRANGYTQIDANATITARAITNDNATATAETFTPTPTLTATEVAVEGAEGAEEEAPPQPTLPPPPTPTINVLAGDSLSQAVTDWEKRMQDVANLTPDDLKELIRAELLKTRLVDAIGAEADTMALQAQARHILVETEEEALSIKKRLDEGEDFADLAQELSTDPGSGSNGGDLGWFSRGQMVAPFDEAAFNQEVGIISEPVETDFGWHIIEILAREERDLEGAALAQAQRGAYDAWLAGSRAGNIENLWTTDSVPPQFQKAAPDLQSLINPTAP